MSICVECGKEYEFDAMDILMCVSGMCVECIRESLHKHGAFPKKLEVIDEGISRM